jgi:hypothetical protein
VIVDIISHRLLRRSSHPRRGGILKGNDAHKTADTDDSDLLARADVVTEERAEDGEPSTEDSQT